MILPYRDYSPRTGQWIGLYPGRPSIGRSFYSGFRSERKALLQVLVYLWKSHRDSVENSEVEIEGMPLLEYISYLQDMEASVLE